MGYGVVMVLVSSARFEPAPFFFGSCGFIYVGSIFGIGASIFYWCRLTGM